MIVFVALFIVTAVALQILPPIPVANSIVTNTSEAGFNLGQTSRTIYITREVAEYRDEHGLTLIPPSGQEFATTFASELSIATQQEWSLEVVADLPAEGDGIYLARLAANHSLAYENGQPTEEGYQLEVTMHRIVVSGTGARGVWWGTRTVLQELFLSNFTAVPAMSTTDAPAYATRGYMLDAGRKWYSPSFLKELCTFASFFKMSEFHYHVSDNYPLNRGHNETWQDVYSQFSLRPQDPELLEGLIERVNETLTRQDYADLEQHCAAHGIAVIPEIESPGHCLAVTKWKPELALGSKDLLNLSHPDSIPTIKQIWAEFLPWFNVKEVHLGADEYDASLADVYIGFVNEMADFINTTSGKVSRAWGTPFDQAKQDIRISPDVIIQHWQYGQSDPLQLEEQGHQIINSQDWWAYISIKNDHMPILPARYPQFFNNSRILNFADEDGWQWEPSLFNPVNKTQQLSSSSTANKGAIMASWNDNGHDASTQLEAYYGWRRGLPIVAARAWSGSRGPPLDPPTIDQSIDFLTAHAPGQNLERRLTLPTANASASDPSGPIFTWTAPATSSAQSANTTAIGAGSKGLNHTLHISASGPFVLSSPADAITLALTASGSLIYNADGTPYPLRSVSESDGFDPGAPGRIWWNVSSSTHEELNLDTMIDNQIIITTTAIEGSRVWINGKWAGRFEVFVFGGRNTLFSWSQMAFVAPLETVGGDGLKKITVWDGVRSVDEVMAAVGQRHPEQAETYTPGNGTQRGGEVSAWVMAMAMLIGGVSLLLVL